MKNTNKALSVMELSILNKGEKEQTGKLQEISSSQKVLDGNKTNEEGQRVPLQGY